MWWLPGLMGMIIGVGGTAVLRAALIQPNPHPRIRLLAKAVTIMLCIEIPLVLAAITFIIAAEAGYFG